MPLMELTLVQDYQGQEIVNRWNYLAAGTPAAVSFSFALTSAIGAIESGGVYPADTLMTDLAACQNGGVSFIETSVKDVYSVTDFFTSPFIVALDGTDATAGQPQSPTMAYGYRTNRTRLDIRRGTKRFVGVGETRTESGGIISQGFLDSQITDLATTMGSVLQYDDSGNILSFTPVIVGKEKYTTPSGRDAYRYYGTEAEQLTHLMQSIVWQPYTQVRTQTSRQYGRGR